MITFPEFKSVTALENLYEGKRPTARKVIKLIKSEPVTEQERQCLDHLQKYIRSLSGDSLSLFLQFTTGSNVIACDCIEVAFTTLEGTAVDQLHTHVDHCWKSHQHISHIMNSQRNSANYYNREIHGNSTLFNVMSLDQILLMPAF